MTGDSFHALVADPAKLDRESVVLLQELSARYPYFRTPRLLLAKNLKDINHIDQRRQLHLAAIYAADRALLLDLMEGLHLRPETVAPAITPEKAEPAASGLQASVPESVPTSESPAIEEKQEPATEEHSVNPVEKTWDDAEAASEKEEVAEPETVATDEPSEVRTPQDMFDLIPEPVLYRIEDALQAEFDAQQPQTPETEPAELSFEAWLARISPSDGAQQNTKTGRPQAMETEEPISRPRPLPKDDFALITDFLAAQPKDGRTQRAEFFKASKAAERSNTIDLTTVSETLANIYEQQGQFELAAKAFEALAAKYPDKSSYFAARKMASSEKAVRP
jgi:hypothetical protein